MRLLSKINEKVSGDQCSPFLIRLFQLTVCPKNFIRRPFGDKIRLPTPPGFFSRSKTGVESISIN